MVVIVACVTVLGMFSILSGVYLVKQGFETGETLIQGGGVAVITGLMGVLGVLIGKRVNGENKENK
jgi:hypothetical protein